MDCQRTHIKAPAACHAVSRTGGVIEAEWGSGKGWAYSDSPGDLAILSLPPLQPLPAWTLGMGWVEVWII